MINRKELCGEIDIQCTCNHTENHGGLKIGGIHTCTCSNATYFPATPTHLMVRLAYFLATPTQLMVRLAYYPATPTQLMVRLAYYPATPTQLMVRLAS